MADLLPFHPSQPFIPLSRLKPGMKGYMLTVLKGTEPSKIPLRIEAVIPQKPGRQYHDLILVKLLGGHKLAEGMSGSPVYIDGKLAGAIRSGWKETSHTLGMAMPAEYMFMLHGNSPSGEKSFPLAAITLTGLDVQSPAMQDLSQRLGLPLKQGVSAGNSAFVPNAPPLKPGGALSVMLAWGDVEIYTLGTVTATDSHGRFIAMGHEFMKRGSVSWPAAGAYIYDVIDTASFPFKLAASLSLNGRVTQDRETGLAGQFGIYPSSISCEFVFINLDTRARDKYNFRVVSDEFMSSSLIEGICRGLAEEAWGRRGQGTMSVSLRIDGRNMPDGWVRKDIFFSGDDITSEAFKHVKTIISAYLSQPFSSVMPSGFTVTVEATERPKVLIIEDVEAPSDAKPGDEIEVSVKLRAWRTSPVTRKFKLTIPEDASGVVELIVRGGGMQSMEQAGIAGGWKSITGLERMLTEFRASDANNQLILELNADRTGGLIRKIKNARRKGAKSTGKKNREPDLLPEEEEYLSETKERRMKEGTLRIYSSEYFVDGLMRRVIHTDD